jgi:hypothetical protein
MASLGLARWDVAVFFIQSDDFRRYTLTRDPAFERVIIIQIYYVVFSIIIIKHYPGATEVGRHPVFHSCFIFLLLKG